MRREPERGRGTAVGAARLLGGVELVGPTGRTVAVRRPQVQLVLAHLLVERRPMGRGEVAELLWGDAPLSPHWQGAVRGVLSKLRDAIDEAGIEGRVEAAADGTVRLIVPEGFAVDLAEAERDVAAAEAAFDAARAEQAVALAAGWAERLVQPVLPAGDGDWVRGLQDRAQDLARRAVVVSARSLLADGRADQAAAVAVAWVVDHPLDEGVHHLRIRALLAAGRRAEALDAHDRLTEVLARELGVGPAAATTALLDAPAVERSGAGVVASPSPRPRLVREGPPFLGRTEELGALRAVWRATVEHEAVAVALIAGSSGIGKTRLAEEVAAEVEAEGAIVCWGRCQPGAGVPFEPVASAVLAQLDADRLAALGEGPALAVELAELVAGDGPLDDPGLARAHRFRTIVRAVRALAASPTLLVVDDLQWASPDVLALLEQVADEVAGPLLILATGRNLAPATHEHLARVQRSAGLVTVELEGLAVGDLLPLVARDPDPEAVASALHRRTAGHPFFVVELAGAAGRAGVPLDPTGVPDVVRDWLGHRIDALPKRLRARLDLASVLGDPIDLGELARAADVEADDVLDDLEALVAQGLLVETGRVDEFAFPHLITREVVLGRLGPSRRARLHLAAARAIEAGPDTVGRHAAVAAHLAEAGDEHRVAAATAGIAAGRAALEQGAWELAEQQFTAARERAGDDGRARAEALTGLGAAVHHQCRPEEAEALLTEAVALARAQRLAEPLADAALSLVGRAGRGAARSLSDAEQAALLREALEGIEALLAQAGAQGPSSGDPVGGAPDRADVVRWETMACRLEGELALALLLTTSLAERAALTTSALERARRIDPPDLRLTARSLLTARVSKLAPHQLPERLADLDQVLALDPDGRNVELGLAARTYRHEDLLRLGRRGDAQAALAGAADLVAEHPHPYWRWAIAAWRGLDALIDGDLDRAEALALEALALQGPEVDGALACYGVNLVDLRLYQGRSGEVLELLGGAADANPHIPCYRAVLALCAAEAGELALAERSYGHFSADGFSSIPEDPNRLLALTVLADVAATLGDRDGVGPLLAQLEPYRGQHALLNCYGGGGAFWGPVAHQLARLEALTGRDDAAERSFAAAEAEAEALGAPLARARIVADPLRAVVA